MIATTDSYSSNRPTSIKPFAKADYKENTANTSLLITNEQTALSQLKEKLANVPHDEKMSLIYAQQVDKNLVTDDHLLGFIHVENFNIDRALTRLLRYWHHRHLVFGDKYILPMTLNGAMKDNVEFIERNPLLTLLPELSESGQGIIYGNSSMIPAGDEVDKVIKFWWYLMHIGMENPIIRKNGFIMLSNDTEFGLRNFQPKLALATCRSADRTFPVKIQSWHFVRCDIFPVVASAVKALLSMNQRQTVFLHGGSEEVILDSLATCSMPRRCIPTELGGALEWSVDAFIKTRLAKEGGGVDIRSNQLSSDVASVYSSQLGSGNTTQSTNKKVEGKKKAKTTKFKVPGRGGDLRMHKAVQARVQNPDLSLTNALLAGGFFFEDLGKPNMKASEAKDSDGVTLYQRKNQLNRRLRYRKQKEKS